MVCIISGENLKIVSFVQIDSILKIYEFKVEIYENLVTLYRPFYYYLIIVLKYTLLSFGLLSAGAFVRGASVRGGFCPWGFYPRGFCPYPVAYTSLLYDEKNSFLTIHIYIHANQRRVTRERPI